MSYRMFGQSYVIPTSYTLPPGYFRPEDYGAKPDYNYATNTWTTNNLTAFNECLDAMKSYTGLGGANTAATMLLAGGYYIGGTLHIQQTVKIVGTGCGFANAGGIRSAPGTTLVFPPTGNCIDVHGGYDLVGSGEWSYFSDFTITSSEKGSRVTLPKPPASHGHGFFISGPVRMERVFIEDIPCDGIHIEAGYNDLDIPRIADGGDGVTPCRNGAVGGSSFRDVYIRNAGWNGVWNFGRDSNVLKFERCDAVANNGWGFWNAAGNGNATYDLCHGESNFGFVNDGFEYDFKTNEEGSNSCLFLNCYSEPPSKNDIRPPSVAFGGTVAESLMASNPNAVSYFNGPISSTRIHLNRTGTRNIRQDVGYANAGDVFTTYQTEDFANVYGVAWNNTTGYLEHNAFQGPGYYRGIAFPGYEAAPRAWGANFPEGFFLGVPGSKSGANKHMEIQRHMCFSDPSDLNSTRTIIELGDIIWRLRPTTGQNVAWICSDSGTTGTLVGVTANINGTATMTVTAGVVDLYVGQYIKTSADSYVETRRITNISGSTVTVDSAWSNTATGVTVQFKAPTYDIFGSVGGSGGRSIQTKTASYALTSGDDVIAVGTRSSVLTMTLPASPTQNQNFTIKDSAGLAGTYSIIIDGNGKNIDGSSTQTISLDYTSIQVIYDGTAWSII